MGLMAMALVWGLAWPAGRAIAQELPPLSSSAWRFTVAAVLLALWVLLRARRGGPGWPRLSTAQWAGLAAAGTAGVFAYTVFFMYAMQHVEAGRAAVVVTTNPVFVTLLAAWWFRETFNARIGAGLALAVVGAATVLTHGQPWRLLVGGVGVGEWLLLGCIAAWVAYSLMAKRLMVGIDSLVAVLITATTGGVLLWIAALWVDGPALAFGGLRVLQGHQLALVVFMAVGPTVLAYAWFFRGIAVLGAGVASSYISLVPVFGVLSAVVLLGEPLEWPLVLGGSLALTGVLVANRAR
jgi:drug/metabolite transporter (DMT)-like permease